MAKRKMPSKVVEDTLPVLNTETEKLKVQPKAKVLNVVIANCKAVNVRERPSTGKDVGVLFTVMAGKHLAVESIADTAWYHVLSVEGKPQTEGFVMKVFTKEV